MTHGCNGIAQIAGEKAERGEILNRTGWTVSMIGHCVDCPRGGDGGLQVTRAI